MKGSIQNSAGQRKAKTIQTAYRNDIYEEEKKVVGG